MTARQLAARGYVVEPGVPLAAVVEAFVSDLLPGVVIRPEVVGVLDRSADRAGCTPHDDASRVTLGP